MGQCAGTGGAEMPAAVANKARTAEATAEAIDVRWDVLSQESWGAEGIERCWNAPLCVQASLGATFHVGLRIQEGAGLDGPRMRREDVFSLAAELGGRPSGDTLVEFVVNVNAWGYGSAGYAAARTRRVVKGEAGGDFVESAGQALAILRTAGAVPAYYFLLNRSAGHVPGWGPAFFTKFLYFADPRNQPGGAGGALILDQVMDGQVHRLVGDPANRMGLGRFRSGSWTTPEYAFYLRLMHRVAGGLTERPRADHVEAVLFRRGQGGKQQRSTKECDSDG